MSSVQCSPYSRKTRNIGYKGEIRPLSIYPNQDFSTSPSRIKLDFKSCSTPSAVKMSASYNERAALPLGDMEIQAQIDTRFEKDNRIGWPQDSLLSWPVKQEFTDGSHSSKPSYDDLPTEVREIMNKAGWPVLVSVAFRYHGTVASNKTLVVESMDVTPDIDEWKKLLVEIRRHLHSREEHCTIEMFQRDCFYHQPIRSDEHEILEAWTTQSQDFLKILRNEDYTSLELLRMSVQSAKSAEIAKPRVLVCSRLVDSTQWHVVRTKLKASLHPSFDLEFQYSDGLQSQYCLGYRRGEGNVTDSFHDPYSATVKMGASIGISGGDGGGTAGAKLSLRDGTHELDFVLTNNHVIESGTKTTVAWNTALTPEHSAVTEQGIQLVSPADADWKKDCNAHFPTMVQIARVVGSRIGYSDSQLLQIEGKIQRQELNDQVVQTLEQELHQMKARYLNGLLAQIEAHQHTSEGKDFSRFGEDVPIMVQQLLNQSKDKATVEEDGTFENRYLGYVWAASGHRVSHFGLNEGPGWLLDWAIGKIAKSRDISNQIPSISKDRELQNLVLNEYATANRYKPAGKRMAVAKHGRTTGWTVGVINHAAVFIKPEKSLVAGHETALTYDSEEVTSDEIVDKYGGSSRALAFLNNVDQSPVMKPGDSGSLVIANELSYPTASWIGLAFASSTNGSRGYMTPIEVVLRDIGNVTGCSISMPQSNQ